MVDYDYNGLTNEVLQRNIKLFDNFEDWTHGAQALSDLGESGRSLFLSIASLSDNYNRRENEMKFSNALRTTVSVKIATFIYMCQQAGIDTNKYIIKDETQRPAKLIKPIPRKVEAKPIVPCFLSADLVAQSLDMRLQSNLQAAMCRMYNDTKSIRETCMKYALGVTKDGSVIFWQIDENGKVRSGKIMQYDWNGHRDKTKDQTKTDWVHSRMKQNGTLSPNWQLSQCLFGAHLLSPTFANDNKIVGFVESEKSALFCSLALPQYVWVACGGFGQERAGDKHKILRGRKVIMFPDAHPNGDFYKRWCEIAEDWKKEGINATVADLLEKGATAEEKAAKIDIADWIEKDWRETYLPSPVEFITSEPQQTEILKAMMKANENVKTLVNSLQLEIAY